MIKIGVMGLGNIAQKAYLPVTTQLRDRAEWHYFTRNQETLKTLKATYGLENVYSDKEAFFQADLDACFIHTPTHTHEPLIKELLMRDIHVFVDKPVSENFQETTALHRLASERKLILHTGFNRRFAPLNQRLKRIPDKNVIINQKNRINVKQSVRFALFDMMIHVVDTTLYLLDDDIKSVQYKVRSDENRYLENAQIIFETKKTIAIASVNMRAGAHTETTEVQALKGTYQVDNLDTLSKNEAGLVSVEKFSDWENTLNKRGFTSLIEGFIDMVERNEKNPINNAKSSIQSHFYVSELYATYLDVL